MWFLDRLNLNLGTNFRKYFQLRAALDLEHKQRVFRVRHEVYCEELKFEPERPDRMETDRFDRHSLHCLMTSEVDPTVSVGCTRLVLDAGDDPEFRFPVEQLCADTINPDLYHPRIYDRSRVAEVSRLAVRKQFRKRKGEAAHAVALGDTDYGTADLPRFPHIPVGLYLGTAALALRNNIDYCLILTEPRLASHFSKLGFNIKQIGGAIEHRGTRVPSIMDVHALVDNLSFFMKPLYKTLEAQIDLSYQEQRVQAWPDSKSNQ